MSSSTEFHLQEWKDGKRVLYYKGVLMGLLWSNPDDLTFTLRRRKTGAVYSAVALIKPITSEIVEEVFEALSWKDAKRVAYTLIKLES